MSISLVPKSSFFCTFLLSFIGLCSWDYLLVRLATCVILGSIWTFQIVQTLNKFEPRETLVEPLRLMTPQPSTEPLSLHRAHLNPRKYQIVASRNRRNIKAIFDITYDHPRVWFQKHFMYYSPFFCLLISQIIAPRNQFSFNFCRSKWNNGRFKDSSPLFVCYNFSLAFKLI